VTLGGRFSGYGLYLLKRASRLCLQTCWDLKRYRWEAGVGRERTGLGLRAQAGASTPIVFDFKYDGPRLRQGRQPAVLSVDGKEVSRQSIPHSISFLMANRRVPFDVGPGQPHRSG